MCFFWICDVALDVFHRVIGVPLWSRAAGDSVYLPWTTGSVVEREDFGETIADDAGGSDYQTKLLVLARWIAFIEFFL